MVVLADIFGHLFQHFMSTTLFGKMFVLVQTHATVGMLQYHYLWGMTTFVTQAVKIVSSINFMEMILSGMGKDVVSSTPAAPGTLLHGS